MGLLKRSLGSNWPGQQPRAIERDVAPLEGTRMSLWNSQIPSWWAENVNGSALLGSAALAEKVWVANRCQQMNSQQIASMPLQWHGPSGVDEPAWVSSPDPNLFPNGIGDALFAIVNQVYGWGFSCQYVTDRYADGYPRSWTVLPSQAVQIKFEDGSRQYQVGESILDSRRVVQIDRNPTTAAHGTSALRAFGQRAYSLLAAGNKSLSVSQDAFPPGYLKSEQRLMSGQAEAAQESWMEKTAARNGGVPVLGQGWDFKASGIDPKDMSLLDTQEWDARVIADAYGVPAVLLNMSLQGGLTYQNPAALGEMWWRFELRTTATRIVNAFSAQMLPRGQWVSVDAADTFAELSDMSDDDDTQASQVAKASPAQQPGRLTAVGGGT